MSLTWVESSAPFVDEECLIDAIEAVGAKWRRQGTTIAITAQMVGEGITLELRHGAWTLRRLSSEQHRQWEARLVAVYEDVSRRKLARLAEEHRRSEEARIRQEKAALVERRRTAIVEKARKQGYEVKERREGAQIRLVLVRRTY